MAGKVAIEMSSKHCATGAVEVLVELLAWAIGVQVTNLKEMIIHIPYNFFSFALKHVERQSA